MIAHLRAALFLLGSAFLGLYVVATFADAVIRAAAP